MMDLSDGLGADLPRLALASGCGYRLDRAALPLRAGCTVEQALGDGEDYELLFALEPREAERLRILWPRKFPKVQLTGIGELAEVEGTEEPKGTKGTKGTKGSKAGGATRRKRKGVGDGYDHFA
jgi:thiamine-monophosphate kinase